jgi:hypothetical protein
MKPRRIEYSAAEMAWLEANRMMVISDYHRDFVAAFGRRDVSAQHLHGLRKRKGWKVGREGNRYKGRRRLYSAEEMDWLEANRTLSLKECHRQFVETFHREDITEGKLRSLRKNAKLKTGRTGHFQKGQAPWSKGKKLGNNPGSARTQFRKGQQPHNYEGAGHESVGDDGYIWIVTDQRNPWTGAATWRVHKHRWLWEQKNGPVPEGHALKCLDGNRLNTDPANWECVPKGMLPRLNGVSVTTIPYDAAPDELKPTIMAAAKVAQRVHERRAK